MIPVGAAPRPMQLVRPLDGNWIELEGLVDHLRVASGLGHTGSLVPLPVMPPRHWLASPRRRLGGADQ